MKNKFTGIFEKALLFSLTNHSGQYRKSSNLPYIWHPISVAKNVEENKISKNLELLMTSALLHDLVEDCEDVTLEIIAQEFGFKVAALVEELSSEPNKIEEVGKTEYLKEKMAKMSSYALVIKLSDRLDNCKDLSDAKPEFKEKYKKQTEEILSHLYAKRNKLSDTHIGLMNKINNALKNVN
jgi:(p)ppGpp synthase/HD superfamily hydrolase